MAAPQRRWFGHPGFPGMLLAALAPAAAAAALTSATLTPAPAVHEVDWRTSPLDLNLRGLNGERFRFHCPPGKPNPGQVLGSGPYTDGSSICAAAVHAGVLRAAAGGLVTIEVRPGQTHYVGSVSHYIESETFDEFWGGSFLVVGPDAAAAPP
jgi:hypothetical protein